MESPSLQERLTRWFFGRPFPADVTVAVGVAVVLVFLGVLDSTDWPYETAFLTMPSWFALAWNLLMTVPLAWARTRPRNATAAVFALGLGHLALGAPLILPMDLAMAYCLYCLSAHASRRASTVAIIGAFVACVAWVLALEYFKEAHGYGVTPAAGIFYFLIFLTAWALGLFRRSRRTMLEALQDRAERLELERDQQEQIASAAERARIAREMHDVVAHSLSSVIAQADGGRYAVRHDAAAAGVALTTIAETGRAALADMRKILGVLRTDPAPGGVPGSSAGAVGGVPGTPGTRVGPGADDSSPGPAPLTPQPDVTEIDSLVGQARSEGMRISYARVGDERAVPIGIGLTLYRVAQQALDNVRRHAGPDPRVTVMVRWGATDLELTVSDDGRGLATESPPGTPGSGYGLIGIRERADLFGGSVTAGPRPGGGFALRFAVPIPAVSDADDLQLTTADEEP